jgi:hypothetical protein
MSALTEFDVVVVVVGGWRGHGFGLLWCEGRREIGWKRGGCWVDEGNLLKVLTCRLLLLDRRVTLQEGMVEEHVEGHSFLSISAEETE